MFTAALSTTARTQKQSGFPRADKEAVVLRKQLEYHTSVRADELAAAAIWWNLRVSY